MNKKTYAGGCHCKIVRFEVDLPASIDVEGCNCSICAMSGNSHIIVPARCFRLISGDDHLGEYRFNTKQARHLFCGICGVKSFYIRRSNPDGFAVTYRCLDRWTDLDATMNEFDGRNWEGSAGGLAGKSR